MNTNHQPRVHGYPPPAPIPPSDGYYAVPGHYPPQPKLGHPTAAWVVGTFGAVFGLIPLLFIISLPAGAVALALGIGAWSKGRKHGVKQGRAGMVLGSLALVLGVVGMVITVGAFDELDQDLTCLDQAETISEIEACE